MRISKKLTALLLSIVTLTGCFSAKTEIVKPVSDSGSVYKAFNEEAQTLYEELEGEDSLEDMPTSFLSVGTDIPDIELTTYDGEIIDLSDYKGKKVILEFVAYWCTYCQNETKEYLNNIVANNEDVVFIQAFLEGAKNDTIEDDDGNEVVEDSIAQFYKDAGAEMNDDIIITQENNDIVDYAFDTLGIKYYPSFLFFDESGKLAYYHNQQLEAEDFQKIIDTVYSEDSLKFYDALKENASDYNRSWEDVKAAFSEEQQEAIASLPLTEDTGEQAFYTNVGQSINVDSKLVDINDKVLDLSGSTGTTIYTVFTEDDVNINSEIAVLNKFQKVMADDDVMFISLFITSNSEDAKTMYDDLTNKPDGYVFDAKNDVPEALYNVMLYASPQVIFVNESLKVCTGSYLGTFSLEYLQDAYKVMTAESAYKVGQ